MNGHGVERSGAQDEVSVSVVRPIRPDEVIKAKRKRVPDVAIDTINDLIARYSFSNGTMANLHEEDVIESLATAGLDRDEIIKRGYLDNILDLYRAEGWNVERVVPRRGGKGVTTFAFRAQKAR
jgi:hypothetical protein